MNIKSITPPILVKLVNTVRKKKLVPITIVTSDAEYLGNKVALICGGTSGIGLSIAKSLVDSHCKVIISGSNEKKMMDIVNTINSDNLKGCIIDYNKPELFADRITEAEAIFGHIDIFISSTGVHTTGVNFWNMPLVEYDKVMDINLKGTYFMCQAILNNMITKHTKGKVLLISSSRGSEPAWSPYGMSKWAIKGLVQGLARDVIQYGITVNAIAPGTTATPLIGFKEGDSIESDENGFNRLITTDEVTSLAKYLVSEASCMITGETIHVSGGRGVFDIR